MSSTESGSQAARSGDRATVSRNSPRASFWVRELPFSLVLILTILGVAYTSFLKQPIMGFWELLAPVIGLVCVGAGWPSANDKSARLRLICTQALHWVSIPAGDEYDVVAERSEDSQRQRDRARRSHVIGARHLYRGNSCSFLASLSSRADHGALRSGGCVDRGIGFDYRLDRGRSARNWRSDLVALARATHKRP